MTAKQKRKLRSERRTESKAASKAASLKTKNRSLKAKNKKLKGQLRSANRENARERRRTRELASPIGMSNFGSYYPNSGYSMFSLASSMVFANVVSGIFFHDYYNHRIRHSWLWHYHHPDYDRSHWSHGRQMEYENRRQEYERQGITPDRDYVEPGTNADEDYIESYVKKHPDRFYGGGSSSVASSTADGDFRSSTSLWQWVFMVICATVLIVAKEGMSLFVWIVAVGCSLLIGGVKFLVVFGIIAILSKFK